MIEIGINAFNGCYTLKEISIPDSVISIGKSAFENCSGLKEVKLSNSLKSISSYTFSNCDGLKKIKIPSSVVEMGYYVFNSESLTDVIIPSSVTSIDPYVFGHFDYLTLWCVKDSYVDKNFSGEYNRVYITEDYNNVAVYPDSESSKYYVVSVISSDSLTADMVSQISESSYIVDTTDTVYESVEINGNEYSAEDFGGNENDYLYVSVINGDSSEISSDDIINNALTLKTVVS